MSAVLSEPRPWYLKVLIAVLVLPVFAFPFMLTNLPADATARMLTWFYPACVLAYAICAWVSYGRRTEVTWILLALLSLTHLGMWILIFGNQ